MLFRMSSKDVVQGIRNVYCRCLPRILWRNILLPNII